jgi:hypothetical protein
LLRFHATWRPEQIGFSSTDLGFLPEDHAMLVCDDHPVVMRDGNHGIDRAIALNPEFPVPLADVSDHDHAYEAQWAMAIRACSRRTRLDRV